MFIQPQPLHTETAFFLGKLLLLLVNGVASIANWVLSGIEDGGMQQNHRTTVVVDMHLVSSVVEPHPARSSRKNSPWSCMSHFCLLFFP